MKRFFTLTFVLTFSLGILNAQLPDGSAAPDWVLTDIDGNTHHLYEYLDAGKTVFIDFFATWCGPCWNYHTSGAMEDLYDIYGPDGTDEVMVFAIEADASTPVSEIYNSSLGDWSAGTPYPIIDDGDGSINNAYNISYFPTIYGICPNRAITEVGQVSTAELYDFAQGCPPIGPLAVNIGEVTGVVCYGDDNGSIELIMAGGILPYTFSWSNGMEEATINGLAPDTYSCTISDGNGETFETGPIVVDGPSAPLVVTPIVSDIDCFGNPGMVEISITGGEPTYDIGWNNGSSDTNVETFTAQTFSVSVTDAYGCTEELDDLTINEPEYPIADAGDIEIISCETPSINLNGSNSSSGPDYAYEWTTIDGVILSGENSVAPTVLSGGTYTLNVINTTTNCTSTSEVMIFEDFIFPELEAGEQQVINCENLTVSLSVIAPSGSSYNYQWTTNDGNIQSGANTVQPTVNQPGNYTLSVQNNTNGCESNISVSVLEDFTTPEAFATGGSLDCNVQSVQISGSSDMENVIYSWTGPNGFTSNEQNPVVTEGGTYTLTVTNPDSGCPISASAEVNVDSVIPDISVAGGSITCANASVQLSASSTTEGVAYQWTGPEEVAYDIPGPEVSQVGSYSLTITAPNGCQNSATLVVQEDLEAPVANAGENDVLNCNASNLVLNGSASSTGVNFTYSWTTENGNILSDENTLTPTLDAPGIYTLNVQNTDNGCEASNSVEITLVSSIVAEISELLDVNCPGDSNGSATISASQGAPPYTYAWSNGETTTTTTGLSTGIYTVTITDSENCYEISSVTISQPEALAANVSTTAQSAYGLDDGMASCTPTGGTAPYSYIWSNGATTSNLENLAPGSYSLTIEDSNGCTSSQTVTVSSFDCLVSANVQATNISCNSVNDGALSVSVAGGTDPLSILWSDGSEGADINNLVPGNYDVTVTDANNCPFVASASISEPAVLQANASWTDESAADAVDGTATANPTGGTAPYMYQWSNGSTEVTISDLVPNEYSVTIADANDCTTVQTFSVVPFSCTLSIDYTFVNVSCFGANDGQISLNLDGGIAPYSYNWSTGDSTPSVTSLASGTYEITVTDDKNCPAIVQVEVEEPTELITTISKIQDAQCIGGNDGSITVEVEGGTGEYTYSWSNGATSNTVSFLPPGSYTVTVNDSNGCESINEAEVVFEDVTLPTVVPQDVTVYLNENGYTFITPDMLDMNSSDNCGIAEMTVDVNEFDCSNIGVNTVSLFVEDVNENSNSAMTTVTVLDDMAPVAVAQNLSVTLNEEGLASIDVAMVDDGSYDNCGIQSIELSQYSFNCQDAGENTINLTVTDKSGNMNTTTALITVTVPDPMDIDEVTFTDVLCAEGVDGSASVSILNGSAPYSYTWSNGLTESDISGLSAGTYEVVVTDAMGCIVTTTIEIAEPAAIEMTINAITNDTDNSNSGAIEIGINGGTGEYTFQWSTLDGEVVSTEEDPTGLSAGDYIVIIADANGCTYSSDPITVDNVVDIWDRQINPEFTLIPNPTKGITTLSVNHLTEDAYLTISSITGKAVFNPQLITAQTLRKEIDLSNFASGIYFVQLRTSDNIITKRLILSK